MADCLTTEPGDNNMATALEIMEQSTVSSVSLFQDLKLKRKRVRDLLADSESARALYLEGVESDQQSDISTGDSAYVSDRGSECGTSATGEEVPAKKIRHADNDMKTVEQSPTKGEEGEKVSFLSGIIGGQNIANNAATFSASNAATAMAYMQGYLMPMPAGLTHMPNMVANGLKFIPMMGLPTHMFPTALHNMPTPMFIAAPHNGYLFSNAQSMSTPAGPIFAYPSQDSTTQASSSSASHRQGKAEDGELKQASSSVSLKFKEPALNESRVEKDHEFITHYTSGKFAYTGHLVENPHNKGHTLSSGTEHVQEESDGEDVMVCAICCDRATGLHYGIITCEGCKGFFKRTVQNKRVYTCVADGDCEINKMQRNRCQYCRFKKCLQMGMVMAAVREDRMPGGRNSGAVYNLYKVKYKKHKRRENMEKSFKQRMAQHALNMEAQLGCLPATYRLPNFSDPLLQSPALSQASQFPLSHFSPLSSSLSSSNSGNLTFVRSQSDSISEADTGIEADRDSMYGSSMGKASPTGSVNNMNDGSGQENSAAFAPYSSSGSTSSHSLTTTTAGSPSVSHSILMTELARKDSLLHIAEDYKIDQFTGSERSVAEALCKVGDDIVLKLVQWMRHLPFHADIPLDLQTKILTSKWHELLLLIMTAYGPIQRRNRGHKFQSSLPSSFAEMYQHYMGRMQQYLNKTFDRFFTMEQLHKEIGGVMEQITKIVLQFSQLNITHKELAALQVILLLSSEEPQKDSVTQRIVHTYQEALRYYILERFPSEANRFGDLLAQIPEIRGASYHLLHSKMIYIPFLLNA